MTDAQKRAGFKTGALSFFSAQAEEFPEDRPAVHRVGPGQRPGHPLRVELHGDQRQMLMLQPLDHPVLRAGGGVQPPARPAHSLVVIAVHREPRAIQPVEQGPLLRL